MKHFMDQNGMKMSNAADIFAVIRKSNGVTRREITAQTGMSWGAVSTITARLLEERYIKEIACNGDKSKGRTPALLTVNDQDHCVIGLDVNATGLSGTLLNLKSEVLHTLSAPSDFSCKKALLASIFAFTERLIASAGRRRIHGIGIAMQGEVDAAAGISVKAPKVADWQDVPIVNILQERFKIPTYIEHDPNCILYAAAPACDTALFRMDNGIGMAATVNGQMLSGRGLLEIGQLILRTERGKIHTLSEFVSMHQMEMRAGLPFSALARQAEEGDPTAAALFDEMADHLALGICNTAGLLHISNILLCGDMCRYAHLFLPRLQKASAELAPRLSLRFALTDVKNAPMGAALMAMKVQLRQIDI